ncbi:MAG: glycosyltransferase [Acidobacteria bacterium]|nr:glycosyltransferase [Acidobacteriota bacterium]
MMPTSTLYICYFGLREPLVQTQVLPYLRQLVAAGFGVHLLTFEPDLRERWTTEATEAQRLELAAEGIGWHALAYHKRPSLPATLYDIAAGARFSARLVRRHGIRLIHARSHVAAAMGAAAKRLTGRPLVFDIRGFFPEEYVDAGVWPAGGRLFRLAKRVERRLLEASDGFVVLTEKAREILFPGGTEGHDARGRPVEVIPCCVDMGRFGAAEALTKAEARRELGLADERRVMVYVGALGGWYLTGEMADLLALAHAEQARTFSLILTQSPPEMIADALRERGVAEASFLVRRVAPADIPRYLKAADAAVSFIKPCYSKLSSSPTKLAEYLASGLPVICNAGVGDVDAVVEGDRVGVVVRELSRESYRAALAGVETLRRDPDTSARCRDTAARRFDLETVGGARYRRLYERVLAKSRK